MTYLQPNKSDRLNMIIGFLVFAVFGGAVWLVIAYNTTVNISHDIEASKTKLGNIGAENTALNNKIVAMLGGNAIPALAAQDNLVEEKNPQYFPLNQQWPIASQQ